MRMHATCLGASSVTKCALGTAGGLLPRHPRPEARRKPACGRWYFRPRSRVRGYAGYERLCAATCLRQVREGKFVPGQKATTVARTRAFQGGYQRTN
jgi:hypothetical protein